MHDSAAAVLLDYMLLILFTRNYLFFFFQAEDGIRDKLVTGVQTCALPIFPRNGRFVPLVWEEPRRGVLCRASDDRGAARSERSEERRVGKSVDLGGRRIIKKKKKKTERAEEYEG